MTGTRKVRTVDLIYIALGAALMAVCSWISVPAAVPFTMQTFGIFTVLLSLGPKRGTSSVAAYLLLGAVGAPVFSNFGGGPGALFGATGGYLMGFLFTGLAYMLGTSAFGYGFWSRALSLLVGLLLCYAFGTGWFIFIYTRATGPMGLSRALSLCVLPFMIPDLLKLALALLVSRRISGHI